MLPEVRSSSEAYGQVSESLGIESVPIAGIAGDQQAALFGQMCRQPGCQEHLRHRLLPAAEHRHDADAIETAAGDDGRVADRRANGYALEGSVFIGGAVVQWIRDGLGPDQDGGRDRAARGQRQRQRRRVLVPAFAGLGAPHWDPYARGTLVGITRGTSSGHLARAALESIAYQVADLLDAMSADAGIPLKELRVDGGAATNNMLMQFQADLLGVPVVRPAVTETTALGAAYLAGIAVGYWKSADDVSGQWKVDRRFEPAMTRAAAAALRERWTEALGRSKGWEKAHRPTA
jgi:glycerol kinase